MYEAADITRGIHFSKLREDGEKKEREKKTDTKKWRSQRKEGQKNVHLLLVSESTVGRKLAKAQELLKMRQNGEEEEEVKITNIADFHVMLHLLFY